MFGSSFGSSFGGTTASSNPNKDIEVSNPPDDAVSCLAFSPATIPGNYLVSGSWDNKVRCWEIDASGKSIPKSEESMTQPVLDVSWSDDGTKVYMAGCDKQVKCWDLASNQSIQVAAHDAPVKTCHWIKGSNYTCLMTTSWDRTVKFWDTRSPNPLHAIELPERSYCADVDFPMAVVSTAGRHILIIQLEGTPSVVKKPDSPLKYQHRCISVFRDKKGVPAGFAVGSVEGRVAIQYNNPAEPKDNFTFKCHRSTGTGSSFQDIFAVNSVRFHPVHGTLATAGSDGRYSYWDKDARTKLKTSEPVDQPVSAAAFNHSGHIYAYAASYDWSKGHEFNNTQVKPKIYLHSCFDDMKARGK
ncbi:mRNA export factor-like [Artemia franciscana]|uniref:mRNA export factor-like n=1 Tax=Artemia franciscana TaxID=6661 RepID=UPI0032DAB7A7